MARMIEEFERKSEMSRSKISKHEDEQPVLKMSEKRSGSESILIEETYYPRDIPKRHNKFDGNESVLTLEDTVDPGINARRGTLLEVHTNDATLFNLESLKFTSQT